MLPQIEKIRFQADYLVPVYNIDENILFLTKWNNGVHWVRIWAVSAKLDQEDKSILESVDAELKRYIDEIAKKLVQGLRNAFARNVYRANVGKALYLEGVTYLRTR